MSDGHRTSTISRPRHDDDSPVASSRPSDSTRPSILNDFTRPIPMDKRLVQQRRNRWVLGLFATLIVAALAASVFVLPLQSWMRQRDELKVRESELATLDAAINDLQTGNDRLLTPEGIKEAARENIDYVEQGEQRITVITAQAATPVLPVGWPYDQIARIAQLRQQQAQAAAAAQLATASTTTVAPTPSP